MNLLRGKGAVVTGIGKVIATAFIEAGASVLLCDIFRLLGLGVTHQRNRT